MKPVVVLMSLGLLFAVTEAAAQDEKEVKELRGVQVGSGNAFEETEAEDSDKPKLDMRDAFKMNAPKPAMPGISLDRSKPKLLTLPRPGSSAPTAAPATRPGNTGTSSASEPAAGRQAETAATPRDMIPATDVVPLSLDPPEYPAQARRRNQQGSVVIEFTVNIAGETEDITVVSANPPRVFDREAIRAVSRWKFMPATENGQAVPQRIRHTIDFNL